MKTLGSTARLFTRAATNQLFRLLFPPVCAGCDRHVAEPGTLCGGCWSKVRFIEKPYCPVLGIPFSHDLGAEILSAEAIADPTPFRRARSVAVHEGVIRDMVHRLKYNDRTDLGPWMARLSGKPFDPDALKRVRQTRQQVGLGANERALNVRGAFRVPDAQEIKVRGRRVLLIDDVYTTGATVKAASRALLRGGASKVDVLTFGRVLGQELSV